MTRYPLLATGLAALLACAAASPASAQSTFRIGLQEDPDALDPHKGNTYVGRVVFAALCDKLIDISPKLELVPQLASSWTISPDGLSITIKLRAGVKFHDGEAMDGEAVKANLDRARTLADSRRKSELASIASVDVVDASTILLKLAKPDATILYALSDRAGMMLAPKSLASDVAAKPVCSGPYKFVERVQNDRIVLERFADHWRKQDYAFDRVIYRAIPDTTVRLANLRSGDLDMLERLAPTDTKSVKSDASLKYVEITGLGYQGLTVNVGNGPAADNPLGRDKRVRQAFSLSLDRRALSDVVFEGTYPPSIQAFPPSSFAHNPDIKLPARDVAKARQLLKEAGLDKAPIDVEIQAANNPVFLRLVEVVQAMAGEAGFNVKIRSTEFATLLREQVAGRFQMSSVGWSGRADPDGNTHVFWTTGGGQNDGKYSNAEVDRLMNEARTRYEPAERRKLYDAVQKIVQEDLPIIYLLYWNWPYVVSAKVDGFVPYPDGIIRLNGMKITR